MNCGLACSFQSLFQGFRSQTVMPISCDDRRAVAGQHGDGGASEASRTAGHQNNTTFERTARQIKIE
jgi:hypothetical protein